MTYLLLLYYTLISQEKRVTIEVKIIIYEFYICFTSNIWFIFIYFESFKGLFFLLCILNDAVDVNNQYFCFLWFTKHPHLNCFLIYFSIFLLSGFIFLFVCFSCFVWVLFSFFLWFACFLGKHNWRGSLSCKRRLTWSLFHN